MMSPLEQLAAFLAHPAPGLVFGPHDSAKVGRRAYATPHLAGEAASPAELTTLLSLTAAHRGIHGDLVECYRQINGAAACMLWESINTREVAALTLLPIEGWEEATEPWLSGDMASFREECELFTQGTWRVIAESPSESTVLVYMFDGEHEGDSLAGKMFCFSMDPVLGYEEVLAPTFGDFIRDLATDPKSLLEKIGFTWYVGNNGSFWGDPVEAYVPDVRGHPDLTEWAR